MSTKELLYTMIDGLTEKQMLELINFLNGRKRSGKTAASVMGILSDYADKGLIPYEDGAWEKAVKQNYENT